MENICFFKYFIFKTYFFLKMLNAPIYKGENIIF